VDKRAAAVLSVIFGGLFLVLFAFLFLAWSAVKSTGSALDLESATTSSGPRLAVLELKGTVGDPQNGIDGDKVVKQIKKLEKEDDIKGFVIRIDSPGGAVAPSQEIYRALLHVRREKKKPVVITMGNLAASGGYYISAAADWIVANPGTLTGSIGVIFQHFNVRGLMETVKVEQTTFKSGKYKDTLSPFRPVGDQDREEIQGLSDDVYDQFISDVAAGRGMKPEEIRPIAEGRIYTGRKAKDLKLVDELGAFDEAAAKAWALAGQSGEPKFQYPKAEKEMTLRELLRGSFQGMFQGAAQGFVQGAAQALPGAAGGLAGHTVPMLLAPALQAQE
jgi:protease IV